MVEDRVQRQLHRTWFRDDGIFCGVLRSAGGFGFRGRPLWPSPGFVCRSGADRRVSLWLCPEHQLLDAGGCGSDWRHRQWRVSSGGLHALEPQSQRTAPRSCLQPARHHRQPGLGAGPGYAGAVDAGLLMAGGLDGGWHAGLCGVGHTAAEPRQAATVGSTRQQKHGRARPRPGFFKNPGGMDVLRIFLLVCRCAQCDPNLCPRGRTPAA